MEVFAFIILMVFIVLLFIGINTPIQNSIEADRRIAHAPPEGYVWCEEINMYLSPHAYERFIKDYYDEHYEEI